MGLSAGLPLDFRKLVAKPLAWVELPSENGKCGPPEGDGDAHWKDKQGKGVGRGGERKEFPLGSSVFELQKVYAHPPPAPPPIHTVLPFLNLNIFPYKNQPGRLLEESPAPPASGLERATSQSKGLSLLC